MRLLRFAVLALLSLLPAVAPVALHAQTTPVTATNVTLGGQPVNGYLYMTPVGGGGPYDGSAMPYSTSSNVLGSTSSQQTFAAVLSNGALASPLVVPDQCTSSSMLPNTNVDYLVQVVNTYPFATYSFRIPASTCYISGSAPTPIEGYRAAQTFAVTPPGLSVFTSMPNSGHCKLPAHLTIFNGTTPTNYECGFDNNFHQVASGSNSGTGTPGSNFLQSNGAPSNSTGNNGDSNLDITTGNVYLKSAGTWGLTGSLKGPQGTPGTQGNPGAAGQGFNFRGAWAASTSYALYDVVTYGGSTYTPIAAFTSGSSFTASNWNVVAAQGQAGTPGTPGAAGAGINPDNTKNGALNLTNTGTAPTTPGANTVQLTQAAPVTTPYAYSMPGTPPPDATHTMLSFALNNGVWQGAWVTAGGTANISQIDYWPMADTSGADSVGSNTLAYTGATATTDTTLGNVLSFSGSSASGGLSSSSTLTNFSNTSAFSLAAWIKPTTVSGYQEVFASITNSGNYTGYTLTTYGAKMTVQLISNLNNSNAMICNTSNSVLTAGTLTHVAMSYDGQQNTSSSVIMYINGASVPVSCSGTLSASIATGGKLGIGKTVDGANLFTGVIARAHVDTGVDSATVIQGYYSGKN